MTCLNDEAADEGGLFEFLGMLDASYCATPSIAKTRNVAYFSPILRFSLYSAELRHAMSLSMLSHCWMTTRDFGGSPSIALAFWPAARIFPPICFVSAMALGEYSLV